jgi:HEPN domain-containing protein
VDPSDVSVDIAAHGRSVVHRMFFETADQDYLGARAAFFDERDFHFWWLAHQATEKYLKTILLMNGASAAKQGHNVIQLLEDIRSLDKRLALPQFSRPDALGQFYWPSEKVTDFIRTLVDLGHSSNRYGIYGYTIQIQTY